MSADRRGAAGPDGGQEQSAHRAGRLGRPDDTGHSRAGPGPPAHATGRMGQARRAQTAARTRAHRSLPLPPSSALLPEETEGLRAGVPGAQKDSRPGREPAHHAPPQQPRPRSSWSTTPAPAARHGPGLLLRAPSHAPARSNSRDPLAAPLTAAGVWRRPQQAPTPAESERSVVCGHSEVVCYC